MLVRLIDTCVLGIDEMNGLVPLDGLATRMFVTATDYVISKYKLNKIRDIENLVPEAIKVIISFTNPISGFYALTHKAGFHIKALFVNPSTYEILNTRDFDLKKHIHFTRRLIRWNANTSRVDQLNLKLTNTEPKKSHSRSGRWVTIDH